MHTLTKRFAGVALAAGALIGGAAPAHAMMELKPSATGDGGVLAVGVDPRPRVVHLTEVTVDGAARIRMRVDDAVQIDPGLPCAAGDEAGQAVVTCDRVGAAFHLFLGSGHDRLEVDPATRFPVHAVGGNGVDHLTGGSGDDALDGGSGWDTIVGGLGRDRLYGGAGPDVLDARDGVADRLIDCTWEGGHRSQSPEEGLADADEADPQPVDCHAVARSHHADERPSAWIRRAYLARGGLIVRYRCTSRRRRCAEVRVRHDGRVVARASVRAGTMAERRVLVALGPKARRLLRASGGIVELVQPGRRALRTVSSPIAPL